MQSHMSHMTVRAKLQPFLATQKPRLMSRARVVVCVADAGKPMQVPKPVEH